MASASTASSTGGAFFAPSSIKVTLIGAGKDALVPRGVEPVVPGRPEGENSGDEAEEVDERSDDILGDGDTVIERTDSTLR